MTKKIRIFLYVLVLLFLIFFTTPGYCDDAIKKLGRGISNIVSCPFELVAQPSKVNETDGPMASITWGILKGVGMTCLRGAVGVYETITFPFPLPKGYRPILTDPEFFFEETSW